MKPTIPRGVTSRPVVRVGQPDALDQDEIAVEEPLEIRVDGEAVATTMRTPGSDRQLALGFLFAEGILASVDDVGSVAHCGRVGQEGFGNVIDVVAAAGSVLDVERVGASRRGTLTTAACGVCGRKSIDDLLARCTVQRDPLTVDAATIAASFERMRAAQPLFARTGGIHAAGVFTAQGEPVVVCEDVGRHNAVDKAVGELLLARRVPAHGCMLLVSGRASFEMVQKAVVAGLSVVASVSAASSLAIDLAHKTETTLVAFARAGRMNVYTAPQRVKG